MVIDGDEYYIIAAMKTRMPAVHELRMVSLSHGRL